MVRISNLVVQCRHYPTISCCGLYMSELPEKDISNVLDYLKKFSNVVGVIGVPGGGAGGAVAPPVFLGSRAIFDQQSGNFGLK